MIEDYPLPLAVDELQRRLNLLQEKAGYCVPAREFVTLRQLLRDGGLHVGIRLQVTGKAQRPGAVALDDMVKVADDFVLTTELQLKQAATRPSPACANDAIFVTVRRLELDYDQARRNRLSISCPHILGGPLRKVRITGRGHLTAKAASASSKLNANLRQWRGVFQCSRC